MTLETISGKMVPRARRPSAGRRAVMDAVAAFRDPFAISDLLAKTRQISPDVGRSTVYRALAWMEEQRRLRRITTPTGRAIFVATDSPGACVIECPECGTTRLFEDESLAAHAEQLATRHGFTLSAAQWTVAASCPRHGKLRRM